MGEEGTVEFRVRPGPYRPDTQARAVLARNREELGHPGLAYLVYEGPHGPLEVFAVDDLKATVVAGGGAGAPVRLEWGPLAKEDGDWVGRLGAGLSCRVDGTDVTIRQPRLGLTRAGRGLQVDAGGRRYLARLRGYRTFVLERDDGSRVATFPAPGREEGRLDAGAGRLEAVLVALLEGSGLRLEPATSL